MGSMKTIPFFILFALLLTSSFAAERKPLPKDTKTKVVKALDLNDDLHMAFFNYDGKKIESLAQTLKEQLKKVKNEEIKKKLFDYVCIKIKKKMFKRMEQNNIGIIDIETSIKENFPIYLECFIPNSVLAIITIN